MRLKNKRKGESGIAFLETVVVAGMMAGIMIALVYGIHNLSTTSLDKDMHLTGSYSQAVGLLNSVDKDFANADRVFLFEDLDTKIYQNTDNYNFDPIILRTIAVPQFSNEAGTGVNGNWFPARNLSDPSPWYNDLLAHAATPIIAASASDHWELHFLQGDKLIAVLTAQYTSSPRSILYKRYTKSSDKPVQSFFTSDISIIPVGFKPIVYNNAMSTMTVRVPNPKKSDQAINKSNEEPLEIIRAAK